MKACRKTRLRRGSATFASIAIVAFVAFAPAVARAQAHPRAAASAKASENTDDSSLKAIGSKSAPITMEVFSDYECPSCRALYEQTLRPMINEYVAAGKVYIVHRDFPLPMHKYGYEAARWVNAAAKIGHFAEVEQALYDNQAAWSTDGNIAKYVASALSPADFKRVSKMMEACQAEAPGVQPASDARGAQSAHGCPFDASIERDKALGNTVPVTATPTFRFFYKGQTYGPTSGFVSWPLLKQFLDQVLSQ